MTRLLVLGLAGVDWASFDRGVEDGALPELAALRARGVAGWLSGAPVTEGPAAWATMLTGVQPEAHGVWRNREAWPGGLRPTSRASWRVAPVWARLAAAGVDTASVAWPAAAPGADSPGVHVDERFPQSSGLQAQDWALPRRCAPDELREALRTRRRHFSQITGDMLAPLLPDLAAIDTVLDDGPELIALGMAQAASIQSAASWILSETGARAVFIHHRWLHQMRRAFEGRRDPRYREVVPGAWRFLDALVGALAKLAGPQALILVVSAGWRASPGLALATGDGVAAEPGVRGADILDIAPTILARFGLEDPALAGRPLAAAPAAVALAPAPGLALRQDSDQLTDEQAIGSLRRQGYHPPPAPEPAWEAQGLAELALIMLDRDPAGAAATAAAALRRDPDCITALTVKARAHVALGEPDPLPALGDALLRVAPDRGWGALAHGAGHVLRREVGRAVPWLRQAEADPDVETLVTTATLWLAASRPAAARRVFAAILAKDPANVPALIGVAMGAVARRDFLAAEQGLLRAMKERPGEPAIYLQLAQTFARSGRKAEAARAAEMAARLGAPSAMAAAARAGRLRL